MPRLKNGSLEKSVTGLGGGGFPPCYSDGYACKLGVLCEFSLTFVAVGGPWSLSASASSGESIEVVEQLAVGDEVYTDRANYLFTDIGSYSPQCKYIRGPNNDKATAAANVQWTLQSNYPVTVYLDMWGGQETMGFAQWNTGWSLSRRALALIVTF